MGTGTAGQARGAEPRPRASGRSGPAGRTANTVGRGQWRGHREGAHARRRHRSSLLARSPGQPGWSAGAGPGGGCRKRWAWGKGDASRVLGTGLGRRAADRDGRGGPRGSAGAGAPPRGDSEPGLPADTGDCNRHGRDHTRDTGRRAAGRGGRPASGGSPRPHGPGRVRWAVDKRAGVWDNMIKPPTPPAGWVCPRVWRSSSRPSSLFLRGRGSLPENHYVFPLSAAECSELYVLT
jgi:hypothetical protein